MKNVLIMLNLLKNGDYYKNPSLSNLGTNIDFKENGGKKGNYCKAKASKPCIQKRKNVFIVPKHEKNRDYHENPSLFILMDKL